MTFTITPAEALLIPLSDAPATPATLFSPRHYFDAVTLLRRRLMMMPMTRSLSCRLYRLFTPILPLLLFIFSPLIIIIMSDDVYYVTTSPLLSYSIIDYH